jgi:hypothetical protein
VVTANLTATDSAGESLLVELSNSSGFAGAIFQPFASQLTWLLAPGEGSRTVWAQFMDPAGNLNLTTTAGTITLKTTPPSSPTLGLTTTNSRANGWTHDPNLTLSLSAGNGATLAQVSEDPGFATFTGVNLSGQTLPLLEPWALGGATPADGPHTVYARYFDAAGNVSLLASASVNLLRTPPRSLPPSLVPGAVVNGASVTTFRPMPARATCSSPATWWGRAVTSPHPRACPSSSRSPPSTARGS